MSIEDMKGASDEDLLDYLTSGFLKNSALGYLPSKGTQVTLGMGMLPPLLQLGFGGQNQLRKDFILSELMKRGYFTGNFDDNKNPHSNPLSYEDYVNRHWIWLLDKYSEQA